MSRNDNDHHPEACLRENRALKEKVRRLEGERDAALAHLRAMEAELGGTDHPPPEKTEPELPGNIEGAEESRKRFQDLVESVNDWVWEVDRNGAYTYVSPHIRDLLGYEPEEVIGKTPFDLMPDSEGERVGRVFGEIVEKRQPFRSLENANLHKDGHLVVLETSGVPFFDEGGDLLGYWGVDRDITERRNMEREREQLIEEDRRRLAMIEAIFDATQDGIAVYDADGKVLRMNAAAEEMLGCTAWEQGMDIDGLWELSRVEKMDGTSLQPGEIPSKRALAGEKVQKILHFRPSGRPPC